MKEEVRLKYRKEVRLREFEEIRKEELWVVVLGLFSFIF